MSDSVARPPTPWSVDVLTLPSVLFKRDRVVGAKTSVAMALLIGLSVSVAHAADVNSVICSERASAERLFGVIMELPSVQADADMSAFESAYREEVEAGRCVAGDFSATGADLVRHPEGGAYFGIVDLGDEGYGIEFDLAFFGAL